jgi:hypothetical protein
LSSEPSSAKRVFLLFMLGVPSVAYVACTCFDIHARWPYVLSLVTCFGGAACFFLRLNRKTSYLVVATSLCSLAGAWAIRAALRGSFDEGTIALLGIGFGLPGVFI